MPPSDDWRQSSGHDPIDLEHRLTSAESTLEGHEQEHSAHRDRHEALVRRMSLLEKAIVGILLVLEVLVQDKMPAIAALLKALKP